MHNVIVKLKLSGLTSAKWANDQCKLKILPYMEDDFNYDRASDPVAIDPLDFSC
jgi:hypothetical protein